MENKYNELIKEQLIELLKIDDECAENLRNAYDAKVLENEKLKSALLDTNKRIDKAIDILDNSSHYLKICIDNDLTPMQLASMILKNEIEVNEIKGSEE